MAGQTVSLAVGVDVKFGSFTGDVATKISLENGQVASVTVLLGFKF